MIQYIRTHTLKISVYIGIGIAQDCISHFLQGCVPALIFRDSCFFKMLRAIQLYDKLCPVTVKIHNIDTKCLLPVKGNG